MNKVISFKDKIYIHLFTCPFRDDLNVVLCGNKKLILYEVKDNNGKIYYLELTLWIYFPAGITLEHYDLCTNDTVGHYGESIIDFKMNRTIPNWFLSKGIRCH